MENTFTQIGNIVAFMSKTVFSSHPWFSVDNSWSIKCSKWKEFKYSTSFNPLPSCYHILPAQHLSLRGCGMWEEDGKNAEQYLSPLQVLVFYQSLNCGFSLKLFLSLVLIFFCLLVSERETLACTSGYVHWLCSWGFP